MFAIVRAIVLVGLIFFYGLFFSTLDQRVQARNVSLEFALPVNFYRVAAGYAKQLVAEMLFIRTSVFLGGVPPGTPPTSYGDALANNFDVMTKLYPRFIDPYYFCQSFLSPISAKFATDASTIFETGIAAYPDNFVLRFFHGTNFFLAMNEPLKGSEAFTEAAKLPKSPPLFGHLAALLSAQGGDITAGLISLQTMLATEKNELVRTRYQQEIAIFEQAIGINKALERYTNKYGAAPNSLEQLVPEFLPKQPEIEDSFILVYNPPNLYLQRPDQKKKTENGIPRK